MQHKCAGESEEQVMALHFPIGAVRPALATVATLALFSLAQAHGPAEWIQRDNYKNAAGELCCGERDCFELSDADVKVTSAGYFVVSTKELIPFHEATPSPTGTYWRCYWGGKRKCFFAPPGST
jgi:hypothetical protein